jgi:hypothetical protein
MAKASVAYGTLIQHAGEGTMKTGLIVIGALAVVLAGCSQASGQGASGGGSGPHAPSVSVSNGQIAVAPDPIIIEKGNKQDIGWQLQQGSPYRFPNDGIVIKDAGDEFKCNREQAGLRFVCKNNHSKPGEYKYTIKLEGTPAVQPLDPWIRNG